MNQASGQPSDQPPIVLEAGEDIPIGSGVKVVDGRMLFRGGTTFVPSGCAFIATESIRKGTKFNGEMIGHPSMPLKALGRLDPELFRPSPPPPVLYQMGEDAMAADFVSLGPDGRLHRHSPQGLNREGASR